MPGFIATKSYNVCKYLLPQDPVHDYSLFPPEWDLPPPDDILPGLDIPQERLTRLSELWNTHTPLTADVLIGYHFSYLHCPLLQEHEYFKQAVLFIMRGRGVFVQRFAKPALPFIKRYRALHPNYKDTDVYKAVLHRDEVFYYPPHTRSTIRSYYQKEWGIRRLYKPLRWFFTGANIKYILDLKQLLENEKQKTQKS